MCICMCTKLRDAKTIKMELNLIGEREVCVRRTEKLDI